MKKLTKDKIEDGKKVRNLEYAQDIQADARAFALQESMHRKDDFELYALWRSIPGTLKRQPAEVISKMGIEDPTILELLKLQSQNDFAREFKIRPYTLSLWNKKINGSIIFDKMKAWCQQLTPSVMVALYKRTQKDGDPSAVKVWLKGVNDWVEKSETEVTGKVEVTGVEIKLRK